MDKACEAEEASAELVMIADEDAASEVDVMTSVLVGTLLELENRSELGEDARLDEGTMLELDISVEVEPRAELLIGFAVEDVSILSRRTELDVNCEDVQKLSLNEGDDTNDVICDEVVELAESELGTALDESAELITIADEDSATMSVDELKNEELLGSSEDEELTASLVLVLVSWNAIDDGVGS